MEIFILSMIGVPLVVKTIFNLMAYKNGYSHGPTRPRPKPKSRPKALNSGKEN